MSAVRIVSASKADARALRELHVATWLATYEHKLPGAFYRRRAAEHRSRDWADLLGRQAAAGGGVLIARHGEDIYGLCQYAPTEDDDDDPSVVGQIQRLYIHPMHQRQGLGRRLLLRTMTSLHDRGLSEVTLWTLENDPRARAFYERLGWMADGARRLDGATDVRYRKQAGPGPLPQ